MKHQTFARFFYLQTRIGVARFFSALILACLFAVPISAQTNPKISVQGTLKSSNGATVADGTYAVTFNLYDVPTGGTVLWFEDAMVEVLGGIYTHYLGTNKPLVAADFIKTLYLGVKVNNYELVPRTEFSYAPYAFSVATVSCSGAVGDVKYSILNPTDFVKENGDCWVPMDGRSLAGSRLAAHTSSYNHANLPDAGGLFFRAQEFSGGGDRDPNRTNTSPIAEFQADLLGSHTHTMQNAGEHTHQYNDRHINEDWIHPQGGTSFSDMHAGGDNTPGFDEIRTTEKSSEHTHTINTAGGPETRPKNLNLWVYIRIN